jgi:hypothetical protein
MKVVMFKEENKYYEKDGKTLRPAYRVKTCRNCRLAEVGSISPFHETISCAIKGDYKPGCPNWRQRIPKLIRCTMRTTEDPKPVESVYYEY